MREKWPLWVALAAGFTGTLMLAVWFGPYWPATPWTVLPREQILAKGRAVAQSFGLDVSGWKPYLVTDVSKSLVRYGKGVTPLTARITFISKDGKTAEVGLNSSGLPMYWGAPDIKTPQGVSGSEDAAANSAFRIMAGAEAKAYKDQSRSMGDNVQEEAYVWRKPPLPNSSLRDRIKVITRHARVVSVERRVHLASLKDEDSEAGEDPAYWSVLEAIFGILGTVGFIAILSIYVLWLARKSINHQFPVRVAVAALLLMTVSMFFGADWDHTHSVEHHEDLPIAPVIFVAAVILGFVAVSRGISLTTRSKWMSLEQLCRLAPLSKSTGEALAAGVLFGPLLAAVPFLIAGCGLFPGSWVLPQNVELLNSPAPLLDSLNVPANIYSIGVFGFTLPVLERLISAPWLRWCLLLPIGAVFFAEQKRVISGPIAAPITAGLLTLVLFWFAWKHFDLLSVLTLQLSASLVMTSWIWGQKRGVPWSPLAVLSGLLLFAFWLYQRGQVIAEGDPRASVPALTGFRAEREKLQAEFSLARRAQQDMLPLTPEVPGYSIAASCTPSLEVGGDLYDFLKLIDGRIGIGVADVSGKGVPAALYMTLTKGLLASVTKDSAELIPVVEEVNRHLHSVTRKKVFVTMALGFLDPEKRVLQCVRAGHNPVVWRQTLLDATTLISPGGLGLGITAGRVFGNQLKIAEMPLSEGDAVVFYSDGITEAMNSALELFGEERLMDAVKRTDGLDAARSLDSILHEVREFLNGVHPQDDMTLVVLRVGQSENLVHRDHGVRGLSVRG